MKARHLVALALAALCGCLADGVERRPPPTASPQAGWVDVELAAGKLPGVSCTAPVDVFDADGRLLAELPGLRDGDTLLVTASAVSCGARTLGAPPVVIRPAGHARMIVGTTRYRGDLRLEWSTVRGVPRLLDRVALEDYLLGVVPSEMPDRFGLEALKAQAVAARSYALSEMAGQGFLYGDTRSQAYGGCDRETSLASRAVFETRGEVLLTGRRIVRAFYHSTCGGRTRPAREVFADAQGGVLEDGVDCPDCQASPFWSWQRSWDGPDVCAAVGLPAAPLQSAAAPSATWPARPGALAVIAGGKAGSASIDDLRERLSAGRPLARQMPSTQLASPPEIVDGRLVLHGRGFGHGVGLCQYGAAGFAARGASYDAILERYYPGATLAAAP